MLQLAKHPECVFWGESKWSNKGCIPKETVLSNGVNYTTCECDHLTNFALLMVGKLFI